jgi:hypothetical protein
MQITLNMICPHEWKTTKLSTDPKPITACQFCFACQTSKFESKGEKNGNKHNSIFLPSSGLFWVNAHCRRLSVMAPPGTAAARGYMAAGDGGPRWMATQHIEVTKFTRTSPSFGASPHLHRALNIASRKVKLGFQSAAVRPINDSLTDFKDTFSDYAGPNVPGARWRRRHRRRRQRKRRPPVSTYTSSTKGAAAWKRVIHVVATPFCGINGVISRGIS